MGADDASVRLHWLKVRTASEAELMEPSLFRSLVKQHLLPLVSGAELLPGTSISPTVRPAVVERGRHSIELKPKQETSWCLTLTRTQTFAKPQEGRVSEIALVKAFVAELAAMPPGFESSIYATDLMARLPRRLVVNTVCPVGVERDAVLVAIDQLEAWSSCSYEGQPIVSAVGFKPEPGASAKKASSKEAISEASAQDPIPSVYLPEAWAEDFGAVLTNSFDTMLVADFSGQLLSYDAMAAPEEPQPLAPVRLGAMAHWSAQHHDRLVIVLNRADELLVLRNGALVFTKRAGSWFFLAPEAIVQQMGGPRNPDLKRAVYASCLDAPFAGTGACIGILNADSTARLKEIAPESADHILSQRSAKARLLQRAINYQPFQALDRRLRQEILAIDGATILDHNGQILAAGAILKVPGGSSGGGRRAAAVALAGFGMGIEVSADGGIEGFRRTTSVVAGKQAGTRMTFRLMK